MPYSSIAKTRIALLEIDEIEQCFRRLRLAAMQLGRENDIDSFASRVSALRERVNAPETSKSEIDVMLATLKDDVQAFLRTLQSRIESGGTDEAGRAGAPWLANAVPGC